MSDFIDGWLTPTLFLLGDWSVRLALAIAALGVALAVRPPRRVATRFLLCRLVFIGGLLVPLTPHFWKVPLPHPGAWVSRAAPESAAPLSPHSEELEGPITAIPARNPAPADRRVVSPMPAVPPAVERHTASPPESQAPLRPGQWLALLLTAAWAGGSLLLGGRLLLGWCWLMHLRRSVAPAGPQAEEVLERCRREAAVRRPVYLATHPAVYAPILLGGRHPCIIVPANWEDLPVATQRACLLHELAHLGHHDDWARFGEEIVRVIFFFHPLVHWLLNRLDGERERLCDALVVRQGIAPRQLAQILAEFARRLGPGRQALARALALPFFNRVTVLDRIQQLLEDDMNRWSSPLPRRRATALAVAVLGLVAGLGSIGSRAEDPNPAPDSPASSAAPSTDDEVSVLVKDSDGKPVAGAVVVLGPQTEEFQARVARSDAEGNVTFSPLPANYNRGMALVVLAGKEGYGPAQGHAAPLQGPAYRRVVLTLTKAHAFAGVVRDKTGKSVAGAEVQFGVVEKSPDGRSASWGYAPVGALRGTPLERFFISRTDDQGHFRLAHVPADKELILRVTAMGMADLDTGANGPTNQYFAKPDARPAELVLGPEARVRGRVTTKLPGVTVAGLSVMAQGTGKRWMVRKQTKIDETGRFSFGGLREGAVEIMLDKAPTGATWTARAVRVEPQPGGVAEATLEVVEGVRVQGRVIVAGTGKPAVGALVNMTGPARPDTWPFSWTAITDAEGKYEFCLPSGETEFAVQLAPRGFILDREKGSRRKVVIPADAKAFTVPPLVVMPAAALKGRVIDARGQPVAHARIVGLCRAGVCAPVNGPAVVTDTDGRFQLERGAAGAFPIGEVAALQVALSSGQEINDVTLTLSRPATVRGKVVDAEGKPVARGEVRAHAADKLENRYYDPTTRMREDGTFELRFIWPGDQFIQAAPFYLEAEQAPADSTRRLRLRVGETVEGVKLLAVDTRR